MQTEYKISYPQMDTINENDFMEYIKTRLNKLSEEKAVPLKEHNIKSITLLFKLPVSGACNIDDLYNRELFNKTIENNVCRINFYNTKLISLVVPEMSDEPPITCQVTFADMDKIYGQISIQNISVKYFWKRLFFKTHQQLKQLMPLQEDESTDDFNRLLSDLYSMISVEKCNTIFLITDNSINECEEAEEKKMHEDYNNDLPF